ncbi:MAG: heme-binding protein, partial [Usitatibacter sp.]
MNPRPSAALLVASIFAFSGASALAQKKVLRTAFRVAENGFDPQRIDDRYSVGICENLFEPLLTYDYLARPAKLVPLTAEAIPEPE